MSNTRSITTALEMSQPRLTARTVIVAISEFRSACFITTRVSESPRALAASMNSADKTSPKLDRSDRTSIAERKRPMVSAGSVRWYR